MIANWKSDVITDIQLVTSSISEPQCPSGYSDIIYYKWPGVDKFCKCFLTSTVNAGTCCTKTKNCKTCRGNNYDAVEERIFTRSRLQDQGRMRLCGKKLIGYNFFDKATDNSGTCKDGFKACDITSKENVFCVPKDEGCPIRSFEITD